MEESKNYEDYHEHPLLLLLNQEQLMKLDESGKLPKCSRCGEKVCAPCFRCTEEECDFYLHKVCAGAPLELNHPFHLNHPLLLEQNPERFGSCLLYFDRCEGFKCYICSCGLILHIKCALFTFNIAENNLKELELVALENDNGWGICLWCEKKSPVDIYDFHGSRFKLHKKCVELPHKLNHSCHRKHSLVQQFRIRKLFCRICLEESPPRFYSLPRFVYACFPCEFAIHVQCVSPSPTIEHESHPHPFNLILSQASFICDACGSGGYYVACTCLTCNIVVHKESISLARFIKSKWHDHRVSHTYFLHRQYFTAMDCIKCHDEVNTDYGSYCCKFCNVIFHSYCALEGEESYDIVSDDEESLDVSVLSLLLLLE